MKRPMKNIQIPWPIDVQSKDRRRPRVSARNSKNIVQAVTLTTPYIPVANNPAPLLSIPMFWNINGA